jgi:hypothetical protein
MLVYGPWSLLAPLQWQPFLRASTLPVFFLHLSCWYEASNLHEICIGGLNCLFVRFPSVTCWTVPTDVLESEIMILSRGLHSSFMQVHSNFIRPPNGTCHTAITSVGCFCMAFTPTQVPYGGTGEAPHRLVSSQTAPVAPQ